MDSENCIESSYLQNQVGNRYSMRSRRQKIYDEGDFKEVVKNFYLLISEINRIASKKISKSTQFKNKLQPQPLQKKQKKQPNPDIRRTDLYNFKKEPIYQQAVFSTQPLFQQQYASLQCNPYLPQLPIQLQSNINQYSQQSTYQATLRRNSYHIAIAYAIYLKNQPREPNLNKDPTLNAKKKMKENSGDGIQQLENGKQLKEDQSQNNNNQDFLIEIDDDGQNNNSQNQDLLQQQINELKDKQEEEKEEQKEEEKEEILDKKEKSQEQEIINVE